MHFDCAKLPAYARFVEHVKRTIAESKPGTLIIYENITEQWSTGIWDTLEEDPEHQHIRKTLDTVTSTFALVVPTDIHDCHHKWFNLSQFEWMQSGTVSREDIELSSPGVATTLNMTSGPYSGSRKEPDLFFRVDGHALPTLAIESGWSETTTKLYDDMNLLFVGGNGAIRTVFIIKWTKHADNVHVSGRIEVYGLDRNGMPVQRGPAQVGIVDQYHIIFKVNLL
ncbi:uncharacterized protein LDX57_002724 [Aspergillus melleus]|uniref:uncharacterized protein n=1 Tax=Aspergillus melleus TaxID=138277 RepID=UPI001E8DD3DD|nr:uncharacterized protein LDX57_002724 [Aspergillus melleus]KAH8424978.1 hypothetical protein LDX57_002724 [Aspergillus melleus]